MPGPPLGSGIVGGVYALAVLPGGDLIVGGQFVAAGGVAANSIARYSSTTSTWIGGSEPVCPAAASSLR